MPQPRFDRPNFDRLSERLLTAGISPRHVRRYVWELSDHFDDLVREEMESGAARELAETRALSRLGHDDDLADAMLSRPELKSLTARFPWAVFGVGPVVLLALSAVAALYLEFGLLQFASYLFNDVIGITPSLTTAKRATFVFTIYNTFVVYGAPLAFAWLLYRMGSRQRMRPAWILTGVAMVCVLGGFQNIIFYDTGCKGCGVLLVESAFIPPFPHFAEGVARALMNLAIAGAFWWLKVKRNASHAMALSHTA